MNKGRILLSAVRASLGGAVSFGARLFLGSGANATFTGQSPAQVNSAIFGAAMNSGSFHYVNINNSYTSGTDLKQTQIGDIGRDEGIQYTTGTLGKSEIIVLNNVAYMKGDESALKYQLGYSQREATAYENRWISFTASDSAYADVTDLVTLGSFGVIRTQMPLFR